MLLSVVLATHKGLQREAVIPVEALFVKSVKAKVLLLKAKLMDLVDQSEQCTSQSEDEDEKKFTANIQMDMKFKAAMSAIRPLIRRLPSDVKKNWKAWVRMLAERGGERRAERNATLRKMYCQLFESIVDERFSVPPPESLDLLLHCGTCELSEEADYSSQWTDVTSTTTESKASASQSTSGGNEDTESVASNCWEGKSQLEDWIAPENHLSMMKDYQDTIEQLRQELIREKTAANLTVNGLNQHVRSLFNKVEVMEQSCVTLDKSYQQDLSNEKHQAQESLENLSQHLKQAEQENLELRTNLQDLNGSVEEMVERSLSTQVPGGEIERMQREIQEIRREFRKHAMKRELYLSNKVAVLKNRMKQYVRVKQLWAETYESRIELIEIDFKFQFKDMQLQLTSEINELASSLAQVEMDKLQVKYNHLLKKICRVARHAMLKYYKKISELDAQWDMTGDERYMALHLTSA